MCLGTIFKQTYPHFEVLAINDGSTDYSLKRLKEYAAQGEYVTFVDGDDFVTPDYLAHMY